MAAKIEPTRKAESVREELVFNQDFKEKLLFKLHELRKDKVLCDVTLRIEGQDFAAHRCVLSAASPYFRSLFTSGFRENQDSVVELQEIKTTTMDQALRFIYTGEALVNASNAQDLLRTADYLIIPSLKAKVSDYLKDTIHASNCLELESLAIQYGCKSLKEAAATYKLQSFVSVVESSDFKALDFERIKELALHDDIIVSKEEEVYEAVVTWVKHDVPSREKLFPELLKCLRFFSMSKSGITEIAKEELVIKSTTCASIIFEAINFFFFPDSFLSTRLQPRTCLRMNELAVIITGGHDANVSNNAYCFLLSKNQWASLPSMPFSRTRHGAAVCCGQLYVVGGQSSHPMCIYNPNQNKWFSTETTAPIGQHCSVTTLDGNLYVIGGDLHLNRVDKYDPGLDEWKEVASMKTSRASHCAVVVENLIYVLGGRDNSVCHKSIECFNASTNQWTDRPSMNVARQFAGAAVSCGKIFIAGGYSDTQCTSLGGSCEMFDPVQDQWSLVSSPVVPRAACAMVTFDNHLYLFGGEDRTYCKYDIVECYDVQNDKWELCGTMPRKLACVQASLLLLPKKFLDTFVK